MFELLLKHLLTSEKVIYMVPYSLSPDFISDKEFSTSANRALFPALVYMKLCMSGILKGFGWEFASVSTSGSVILPWRVRLALICASTAKGAGEGFKLTYGSAPSSVSIPLLKGRLCVQSSKDKRWNNGEGFPEYWMHSELAAGPIPQQRLLSRNCCWSCPRTERNRCPARRQSLAFPEDRAIVPH